MTSRIHFAIVILLLFIVATPIFAPLIQNQGWLIGGDWATPISTIQLNKQLEFSSHSWGGLNLFGFHQITLSPALPFTWSYLFIREILPVGVNIFILAILFIICSAGFYLLFSCLNIQNISSFVAISTFLFSALSFNYFLMGWIYTLVVLALLPLCLWAFIRGLEGNRSLLMLSGLIFALSPVQSQAVIWYFICLVAVATTNYFIQRNAKRVIISIVVVLLIFVLINAYWLPGLFIYPPSYVASSDIINSAVSLGIMGNYQPINTLRIWGGLHNYQFETIQNLSGLGVFSFFVPALAIIGLLIERSSYKWAFAFLMLSPIFLIFLGNNRGLLAAIPFANAFRDIPRFSVLALLGTSVLAGMGASGIFQWATVRWGNHGKAVVAFLVAFGITSATFPWWSGEITNWQATKGADIRLRFKDFPKSYFHLESRMSEERLLQKAMYYPLGGTVSFANDAQFRGPYQEYQDIFAGYSPIPGLISISDRRLGAIDVINDLLSHEIPDRDQLNMLAESGVRIFVFRRNLLGPFPTPSASLIREMVKNGEWNHWFEDGDVIAYAAKRFKPPVFIASFSNVGADSRVPTVEFRKIDPTLYRVRIHNLLEPVLLVLNETHNINWRIAIDNFERPIAPFLNTVYKLDKSEGAASIIDIKNYLSSELITLPASDAASYFFQNEKPSLGFISTKNQGSIQNDNLPVPSFLNVLKMPSVLADSHFIANGFANGWVLDAEKMCKISKNCMRGTDGKLSIDLVIEFKPQRIFNIGGLVTLITVALLLLSWVFFIVRWFQLRSETLTIRNKEAKCV